MLAIPIFRARVAPVLDWCSRIIIIPEEGSSAASGRHIDVTEESIFILMRTLREKGIKTLICGALSPEMLSYCESIGLRIIHGIAGEIEEVLQAYREQKLDHPKYWLPGCRCQRRYRDNAACAKGLQYKEEGQIPGTRGKDPTVGRKGPGKLEGRCVCPSCGARAKHEPGIPCVQIRCPKCSDPMIRG